MENNRTKLYERCRKTLLEIKEERLNSLKSIDAALTTQVTGDDVDRANAIEDQDIAVAQREAFIRELRDIELALERIEEGTYGVCEETGEQIEEKRLLALPWTVLSLEGAIMREKEAGQRKAG